MKEILKIFDAFYGGIQSGDKSNVVGAVSNAEESIDNAVFFGINM